MIYYFFVIIAAYIVGQTLFTWHYYKKGKKLSEKPLTQSINLGNKKNKELKILIAGDSVAAGIGASSHKKTIAYRLAESLSKKRNVILKNTGIPGLKIKDLLNQKHEGKYDILIAVIASNDLFKFTSLKDFKQSTRALLKNYSKQTKQLIILGPLRVDTCTAIPFFLRIIYYFRGFTYLNIIKNETKKYNNIHHTSSYYITSIEKYGHVEGKDRFHPSDEGYRMYADLLLNIINKSQ